MEITHIEQGKLSCVNNVQLCATLCATINKSEPSPCISSTFFIEKGEHQKKGHHLIKVHILTEVYLPLYTS